MLRFLLELLTLIVCGFWGSKQTDGWMQFVLAFGIPVGLASLWGIFAVKNDPSRSGKTVVSTPGALRLLLEILFFAFGIWTVYDMGFEILSALFGVVVFAHYVFSLKRIQWLLKH